MAVPPGDSRVCDDRFGGRCGGRSPGDAHPLSSAWRPIAASGTTSAIEQRRVGEVIVENLLSAVSTRPTPSGLVAFVALGCVPCLPPEFSANCVEKLWISPVFWQ